VAERHACRLRVVRAITQAPSCRARGHGEGDQSEEKCNVQPRRRPGDAIGGPLNAAETFHAVEQDGSEKAEEFCEDASQRSRCERCAERQKSDGDDHTSEENRGNIT